MRHLLISVLQKLQILLYRIGGIYGPNEASMLPRAAKMMTMGFFNIRHSGYQKLKIDFLHIDNAVQAHIKVIENTFSTDSVPDIGLTFG